MKKRVVFAEKCGKYLAWTNAETFEGAGKVTSIVDWKYAREVVETVEVSKQEIAEKFGISLEQLNIID